MSAKKQLEREIREAYIFLREKNTTIPSDTLQFMLDASLEKLEKAQDTICKHKGCVDKCVKGFNGYCLRHYIHPTSQ